MEDKIAEFRGLLVKDVTVCLLDMRMVVVLLLLVGGVLPERGWAQADSRAEFMAFVAEFAQNDSIQRAHTRFPLEYCTWQPGMAEETPDTTYINESGWEPLRLHPLPHGGKIESEGGTYAQRYVIKELLAVVEIRGVDNGLYTNLVFCHYGGSWLLVRIEEYST